jgi:hypothetical protein
MAKSKRQSSDGIMTAKKVLDTVIENSEKPTSKKKQSKKIKKK